MELQHNVSLRPYCTLRAGGEADAFLVASSVNELALAAQNAFQQGQTFTVLGWGSNVLPADQGVDGVTCINATSSIQLDPDGCLTVDSGYGFQDLFLRTAQGGFAGFSFAVGIPGTVGGALVSNAGAYRSNISEHLVAVEWVRDGVRQWVEPHALELSYRDSILRRSDPPPITLLQLKFILGRGDPKAIYNEAREYQRQRISKQPPSASAGSFFKNVNDAELAQRLETLPDGLKKAGVVPAGYLLEAAGLKGVSFGGAQFSSRHANFLMNVGGASASALRSLAEFAKQRVKEDFGVGLEEEALYLGRWETFEPEKIPG